MRRVLFVDDEPRVLEDLQQMLRSGTVDWETAFAPGGDAALALLEASPFDVIVSDLRMPGIDGAELLRRVRKQYPQMVRISLSAQTEISAALQLVPVAHQFLPKPCDLDMLRVAIGRACHLQALLNDESIRRTVTSLGELPSMSRTYDQLSRALADPDSSLKDVAKIIEQDVGISARVLQLVNSAFFGTAHSMTNVRNAVSYLGIQNIKNLVLSMEVFRAFTSKRKVPGFSLDQLQRHAQVAAYIASRLPVPKHLADIAVVAALLHDVGKLVLAWKLSDEFEQTLVEAQELHCPMFRVEERERGYGHAEIGAYLLGLWGIPYAVVEAVALHHSPNRVAHKGFDPISAVFTANLLAHDIDESSNGDAPIYDLESFQHEFTQLGIVDLVPEWREMLKKTPPQPSPA